MLYDEVKHQLRFEYNPLFSELITSSILKNNLGIIQSEAQNRENLRVLRLGEKSSTVIKRL